jgi:hypothetical protein
MTKKQIIIGTDLGGGIIDKQDEQSRESFLGASYLLTPEVPEVFETLRKLVEATRGKNGKCNVYVISACDTALRKKAEWWLDHRQFCERTGIPRDQVLFCDSRRQKAEVCAKLGVTHLVDDRLEVLSQVAEGTEKFLFRPDAAEALAFPTSIRTVRLADSWTDILGYILKDR